MVLVMGNRFSVGAEEQMSALQKKLEDLQAENGRLKQNARLEDAGGVGAKHGRRGGR